MPGKRVWSLVLPGSLNAQRGLTRTEAMREARKHGVPFIVHGSMQSLTLLNAAEANAVYRMVRAMREGGGK